MIRKAAELDVTYQEKMRGGEGRVEFRHLLGEQQLTPNGRLLAHLVLPPGASIGYHQHQGEHEVYYVLQGQGRLTQDGQVYELSVGDMAHCPDGSSHGLENPTDAELHLLATVLYTLG